MRILFTTLLVTLSSIAYAKQKTITDTGEEVILHEDNTWEYTDKPNQSKSEIATNLKSFQKPTDSSFLLKSKKINLHI